MAGLPSPFGQNGGFSQDPLDKMDGSTNQLQCKRVSYGWFYSTSGVKRLALLHPMGKTAGFTGPWGKYS